MKTIVIAGGTGFLGQALARFFTERGWQVKILTRHANATLKHGTTINWDACVIGPWIHELEGTDALVNLCGRSVNCRYHARNRATILDSRLATTELLANAIEKLDTPPPVWLNAASATIYRHSLDTAMTEDAGELGDGFSVDVCRAWENAFFAPRLPRTRRIALRTSMVLGHAKNSVYPVLRRITRCGMGGRFGDGKQMMSWIHHRDFVRAVHFLIEEADLEGPVNITAPAPVTNSVFMKTLRESLGIPFGVPHFCACMELAAFLARTETELILKSRFAFPEKLLSHRFVFNFPFLDEALADLAHPAIELATFPDHACKHTP